MEMRTTDSNCGTSAVVGTKVVVLPPQGGRSGYGNIHKCKTASNRHVEHRQVYWQICVDYSDKVNQVCVHHINDKYQVKETFMHLRPTTASGYNHRQL